jgi:hypothetical protein
MTSRFVFRSVSVILAVGSGFIGLAQTPTQPISETYILSQAICLAPAPLPPLPLKDGCTAQTIPRSSILLGSIVEIQLPGGPSVWKESFVSPGLQKIGETEVLDSPGRIAGANKIYRFRYLYLLFTTVGPRIITLAESPPSVSEGTFTFRIVVNPNG